MDDIGKTTNLQGFGQHFCLFQCHSYLISWIENNSYRIIGPNREIYIETGPEPDNESYITEIQFPIEKA